MRIFVHSGPENTAIALQTALAKATEYDIPIVVATTTGATGVLLAQMARTKGFAGDIIAVSTVFGSDKDNPAQNKLTAENRALLLQNDVRIITAAHVLSGAERSLSTQFGGVYPVEIIAHTLRMLSQGAKVGVEIASMAADAGYIKAGESVIAVGGNGQGADTALRLLPAYTQNILQTHIQEIYCKPV